MEHLHRLPNRSGLWQDSEQRTCQLDEQIHDVIVELTQQEQRQKKKFMPAYLLPRFPKTTLQMRIRSAGSR